MSIKAFGRNRDKKGAFDISSEFRRWISHSTDETQPSRASTVVPGADDPKGPLGLDLLHVPSDPTFDFVFVHGLGGGSRKTWSKTGSVGHFWPAEWLPKDPAFQGVRVHSYGYNSDWVKGNDNCLNIHHIGKSLLGELATSPHIAGSNTCLVLIGHSMGGLVIKKAYMLARQDPLFSDLAARVRAIFFFGTPHRGSDSARLLKNILQIASSAPAYVTDLVRGSGAIQSINDEFRQFSGQVELWSFYETQKLAAKGFSTLIVDPESATLGYREERQMPMNADHRSICKFDTPLDRNYIIIRNALASTIQAVADSEAKARSVVHRSSIQTLSEYLGINESVEDDFIMVQDARLEGTCRWFSSKANYQDWKSADNAAPTIMWVDGKPAAGKSVLLGFVIEDLKLSGFNCSYYYFKHGDKSKSMLSTCLRSLAFQMASTDHKVLERLLKLYAEHTRLDLDNERRLWRSLFVSGAFQVITTPQFWVLDAIDECSNIAVFFDSMLSRLAESAQIRVLFTSRETPELLKHFSSLGSRRVLREHITAEDTLPDIQLLVTRSAETLVVEDEESRLELVNMVIEKSRGSFLWTHLVLEELSGAFSDEAVKQILDEVPRGMECLYRRALETMNQATRGKKLAKAILEWVTCAMRPLTATELSACLEIELKDRFPKLSDTITALCGQLVTVDKQGRVHMIHETAREFLLDDELDSEFAITGTGAHTKIAKVCLQYLTGDELKPFRIGQRLSSTQKALKAKSVFFAYACASFSYHLARADPAANDLLALVHDFVRLNILACIEDSAQSQNLAILVRVAKDLKVYTEMCMVKRSPLRRDLQTMKTWTTDLERIVAKFSDALVTMPSAIYSLIPPFCPAQSAIHNIAAVGKKISVLGLPGLQWDDRLSCIDFRQEKTSAICFGEEFLAIGLTWGRVALYYPVSCQEYRSLSHGEMVRHLCFKSKSDILASCGLKSIRVWNIRTGQLLHTLQSPRKCIGLWIDANFLIAPSTRSELWSWDLDNGAAMQPTVPWRDSYQDDSGFLRRPPCALSVGIAHKMLAVAYSGKPVILWDLGDASFYGTCGKKNATGNTSLHPVQVLQFNPNRNIELLAVSYLDGDLVIIDPFDDTELERQHASCHTLAASPDGRLLAGGGGAGVIQIFEFDTLRLLYKVRTSDIWIKQLSFSQDGTSLADLRGSQCNVWTPPVLLGWSMEDDHIGVDAPNTYIDTPQTHQNPRITAMALLTEGAVLGKEDGTVCLHDVTSGQHLPQQLYSHQAPVRLLHWLSRSREIVSICDANRIMVRSLDDVRNTQRPRHGTPHMDAHLHCEGNTIIRLVAGEEVRKLILSTRQSDHFWDLQTATQHSSKTYNDDGLVETRVWVQHPKSALHVACIRSHSVQIHSWEDWIQVVCIDLGINLHGVQLKSAALCHGKAMQVLLEVENINGSADTQDIVSVDLPDMTSETTACALPEAVSSTHTYADIHHGYRAEVTIRTVGSDQPPGPPATTNIAVPFPREVVARVAHVIGISCNASNNNNRLVFLDTKSWVCSTELNGPYQSTGGSSATPTTYTRHFFVPYDWLAGMRYLVAAVSSGRDVIIAKSGDLAVIKGGLDFSEVVNLDEPTPVAVTRLGRQNSLLAVPGS